MPARTSTELPSQFTESLLSLGFSQYEARCYVGLLGPGPQTGYAVAKVTGVPQPKVYEALRRLVSRGAARQLEGDPVLFVAVPPDDLLDDLQASFDRRLEVAREASTTVEVSDESHASEPVAQLADRARVVSAATKLLATASRRVYLSATATELTALRLPLQATAKRGVDVVVLAFGKMPFQVLGARVFRHASTDGVVFRHHQSRHIALVVDSRELVFGLAPDGTSWSGISTDSAPVIAAVKGYIRHDIDIQQIFSDFRSELVEAYGPGLQALESYRAEPVVDSAEIVQPISGRTPSRNRSAG